MVESLKNRHELVVVSSGEACGFSRKEGRNSGEKKPPLFAAPPRRDKQSFFTGIELVCRELTTSANDVDPCWLARGVRSAPKSESAKHSLFVFASKQGKEEKEGQQRKGGKVIEKALNCPITTALVRFSRTWPETCSVFGPGQRRERPAANGLLVWSLRT